MNKKERELREWIENELKKKSTYGQFKTENCTQGGWFIWIMDAVNICMEIVKKEKRRKT
jgi:hypothetical protein